IVGTGGSFSGVIQDAGPGLVGSLVMGSGSQALSGVNTYTGGTTVNAGILSFGVINALNPAGALTMNGGTFDLNGVSHTVRALSGTGGTIAIGGSTLFAGDSTNTTLAAAITGAGGFVKQGSGMLTLTGASTNVSTAVNAGTLQLGAGGSLSPTVGLTIN